MDFSKSLLLIMSLSCLLLSANVNASPSTNAAAVDPLLIKLCKDVEYSSLCIETISPYLQGPFTPVKALEIEIEATKKQIEKVVDIIANLLKDPKTSKQLASTLDVCKEVYDSAVDSIMEATKAVSKHDWKLAGFPLSAVISYQQTCEDSSKEPPAADLPFPNDSVAVFQLTGNCLDIIHELKSTM